MVKKHFHLVFLYVDKYLVLHRVLFLRNCVFKVIYKYSVVNLININLCNISGVLKSDRSKVYQVFEVD